MSERDSIQRERNQAIAEVVHFARNLRLEGRFGPDSKRHYRRMCAALGAIDAANAKLEELDRIERIVRETIAAAKP